MGPALNKLPKVASRACSLLLEELLSILRADLVALWAYGAGVFPNPPRRLVDVDLHALLARPPDAENVLRVRDAHDRVAREVGVEWDAWYVLASEAETSRFPRHLLRETELRDEAWALHRAHWLAGRYVHLHGRHPEEVVSAPSWGELLEGLRLELAHLQRHVTAGDNDPPEAAYAILNGCRILSSIETRNVVISKREASAWALEHLPPGWHEAIRAATRVYDAEEGPDDAGVLGAAMGPLVGIVSRVLSDHAGYLPQLPAGGDLD